MFLSWYLYIFYPKEKLENVDINENSHIYPYNVQLEQNKIINQSIDINTSYIDYMDNLNVENKNKTYKNRDEIYKDIWQLDKPTCKEDTFYCK